MKTIDLTGPDGNAFALMGYAKKAARALDYTEVEQKELIDDMTNGDYDHLKKVFRKHFSEYYVLYE
jgi:hypothetical protein